MPPGGKIAWEYGFRVGGDYGKILTFGRLLCSQIDGAIV